MSSPPKKQKTGENQLSQLKKHTIVVADTGDIESIKLYKPTDATTNPSLILNAASNENYKHLVTQAAEFAKENIAKYSESGGAEEMMALAVDKVCVNFGVEILKIVDGVVSTEVDARLSFDAEKSVVRAKRIIQLYEEQGVENAKDRVLIKLASTWEGFQAAKELKKDGIKCNMTLLFSFAQAVAAAEAEVELISPFVGRILDWYKANSSREVVETYKDAVNDPGCVSVTNIYNYYKKYGYKTIVMGASFRTKDEIIQLTGCDKLTIGPKFLEELEASDEEIAVNLTEEAAQAASSVPEKISLNEPQYRWEMCQDQMATEKLAEGIRNFAKDIVKLEDIIRPMLA